MPEPMRIGTVPFLNAWPLIHGLDGRDDVTLRLVPPSALAALLKAGEVDAAMAPAIDYFRLAASHGERARAGGAAGFVALPVAAIGSRGAIGSVRLFGFTEPDAVRRVVLDPASHTSNALARIVLARRLGRRTHFAMPDDAPGEPLDRALGERPDTRRARGVSAPAAHHPRQAGGGSPEAPRAPDAEVVIGDRALVAERPGAAWVLDLGEAWERIAHLPFVYAFWIARAGGPIGALVALLSAARDSGLAAREALAARAARELGIPAETAARYLTEQVRYTFGAPERRGLLAFYRMAVEEGLAPEGVRLDVARAAGGETP